MQPDKLTVLADITVRSAEMDQQHAGKLIDVKQMMYHELKRKLHWRRDCRTENAGASSQSIRFF